MQRFTQSHPYDKLVHSVGCVLLNLNSTKPEHHYKVVPQVTLVVLFAVIFLTESARSHKAELKIYSWFGKNATKDLPAGVEEGEGGGEDPDNATPKCHSPTFKITHFYKLHNNFLPTILAAAPALWALQVSPRLPSAP